MFQPVIVMMAYLTSFRDGTGEVHLVSDALHPQPLPQIQVPADAIGHDGRLAVHQALAAINRNASLQAFRPLVVVTGHDLIQPGCASLWGYADPANQTAVVSTFRLQDPDRSKTGARLHNLILHEIGHLHGMSHCKHPNCLMHPVQTTDALDARNGQPCNHHPGTPPKPRLRHRFAALAFLALAFAGINLAAILLKRPPKAPFRVLEASSPAGDMRQILLFDDERLPQHGLSADPAKTSDALNRLYRMIDPPRLQVIAHGEREAIVMSQGAELLRLRDEHAATEAERLTQQLNSLIAAKGHRHSLCAECHLNRKPEVLEAANGRKWNFGPF